MERRDRLWLNQLVGNVHDGSDIRPQRIVRVVVVTPHLIASSDHVVDNANGSQGGQDTIGAFKYIDVDTSYHFLSGRVPAEAVSTCTLQARVDGLKVIHASYAYHADPNRNAVEYEVLEGGEVEHLIPQRKGFNSQPKAMCNPQIVRGALLICANRWRLSWTPAKSTPSVVPLDILSPTPFGTAGLRSLVVERAFEYSGS